MRVKGKSFNERITFSRDVISTLLMTILGSYTNREVVFSTFGNHLIRF